MSQHPELQALVGLQVDAAKKRAQELGFSPRVISVDGKASIVTMDWREDRVNFTVVQDVVSKVTIG